MLTMLAFFLAIGAVAGVLGGLLGIGGGMILVVALVWFLPLHGVPQEAAMHAALASGMASIILTSLSSAYAHHRRGSVLWTSVAWLVPGVLIGAWLGSRFAISLDGEVLRWCVVAYCIVIGAQMLLSKAPKAGAADVVPRGPGLSAAGTGIGAVSSVVGIGGGSMTVPLLVWLGVAPVRAVGSSSALGFFVALSAASGYALQAPPGALPEYAIGYVYLPAAIGVALASVIAAPFGTRLAHAISGHALKRVFGCFMFVMAASLAFW
ncbi:sulfite exporter TauE/SafE family protein [Luteimonas abyssi]|uniref:sulfite exporter TauE/SafE family protein n=1 Tax=Luteimonas abyssi TaxID=1247514 RepID=UPI000ACFB944|nr:sulfite exporter TauE/SafE family protein [Luteimonas abyssi]